MRVLIVSSCPTHPTIAGNRKFILDLCEQLKKMGHEVFFLYINLLSIHKNKELENVIELQKEYWKENLFIYNQNIFQKIYSHFLLYYRRLFFKGYNKCDDKYPYRLHHKINFLNQYNKLS